MKYLLYLIATVTAIGLNSCNNFLDVSSSEKILQKDLFKESHGFRLAVNGVYRSLSSVDLYGENLTWGFLSVLGHNYEASLLTLPEHMFYGAFFDWKTSHVEQVCDNIWRKSYNTIANCNNILQEVEAKDSTFFAGKTLEKNIILGEMYGIRAMLHFDLLRLFAPAPVIGYQGKTIPYVKKFPEYRPEHLTTSEVLENIIADLIKAQTTLGPIDTNISFFESSDNRYRLSSTEIKEESFFQFRAFRMNFFAATALLARVHIYNQNFDKAFENAETIYDYHKKGWFNWTDPLYQGEINDIDFIHPKRPKELVLAFYNNKNFENYEKYILQSDQGSMKFRMNNMDILFQGDFDDFRHKGWYNRDGLMHYLTWLRPTGTSFDVQEIINDQGPLIPIIRFSEMYHILIEYYIKKGNISEAVELLNELRLNRGAKAPIPEDIDPGVLMDKLVNDIIRETLTEGQTFFMFKRLNRNIFNGANDIVMKPENWTAPVPYSETAF